MTIGIERMIKELGYFEITRRNPDDDRPLAVRCNLCDYGIEKSPTQDPFGLVDDSFDHMQYLHRDLIPRKE